MNNKKTRSKKAPAKKTANAVPPARMSKLAAEELQAMYREVIGRETTSENRAYLIWKIREAKSGRVRVGPPVKRIAAGPQQVLSLRVDEDAVPLLDAAWERHGMRIRMDLVRRALYRELSALGEAEAAARFAPAEAT